jgi:hypothetical protein
VKKFALSCYSMQRWTADGDSRRRHSRCGRHLKREHSNHSRACSHRQVTTLLPLCAEYRYAADDKLGKWVSKQYYAVLSASYLHQFRTPRPYPYASYATVSPQQVPYVSRS